MHERAWSSNKPQLAHARPTMSYIHLVTSLPDLPHGKSTCLYTTLQSRRKRSGLSGFDRTTFSLKQQKKEKVPCRLPSAICTRSSPSISSHFLSTSKLRDAVHEHTHGVNRLGTSVDYNCALRMLTAMKRTTEVG